MHYLQYAKSEKSLLKHIDVLKNGNYRSVVLYYFTVFMYFQEKENKKQLIKKKLDREKFQSYGNITEMSNQ